MTVSLLHPSWQGRTRWSLFTPLQGAAIQTHIPEGLGMTSALFTEAIIGLEATPPPAHPSRIIPVTAEGHTCLCFPAEEIQIHPPSKCCVHS